MKRLRLVRLVSVSRGLALGLTATLAVLVVGSACTAIVTRVGPGGECFVATDCAPGLICIEQADKTRVCSDDLSRVAGRAPPEAGPEEQDGGDAEGGVPDGSAGDVTQPPPDTGLPDTNQPPPDTGAPPQDAGED